MTIFSVTRYKLLLVLYTRIFIDPNKISIQTWLFPVAINFRNISVVNEFAIIRDNYKLMLIRDIKRTGNCKLLNVIAILLVFFISQENLLWAKDLFSFFCEMSHNRKDFPGLLRYNVGSLLDRGTVIFFRERHYHRFDPLSAQAVAGDTDERFPGRSGHGWSSVNHILHPRKGK